MLGFIAIIFVIVSVILMALMIGLFRWLAKRYDKPINKWQSLGAFIGFILSFVIIIGLIQMCVFCQ